jgi:hypothetical protein
MLRNSSIGGWVVFAAVSVLSGCETLDTVRVRDDNAPAYSGTLISRPEEMRHGRNGNIQSGIEFGYERYKGESIQVLSATQYLSLEKGRINGPQQSHNTSDIYHGHVAYNMLFTLGHHFEFEPALGAEFDKIEMTAQGSLPASPLIKESQHNWQAMLALTPRWNFNEYFGIESRFNGGTNFAGTTVSGNTTSFVIRPVPNILLKAGYYSREYEFETPKGLSNFQPRFSGFSGNITFIF